MNAAAILKLLGLAIKYGPIVLQLVRASQPVLKVLRQQAPELAGPLSQLAKEAFPHLSQREAMQQALEIITEPNATRRINEERGGD